MAWIYNTELSKELKEGAKLQQTRDIIPNQLADKVVPVMEVNPKLLRRINIVRNVSSAVTAGMTAYTTPTGAQDFYLTGFQFSLTKDAACDAATGTLTITATIDGASRVLGNYSHITLTADSVIIDREFTIPVKIDRGSTIANSITFAAGVCTRSLCITGYTVDNPNA